MVFLQSKRLSNNGKLFNADCDSVNVTLWELQWIYQSFTQLTWVSPYSAQQTPLSERDSSQYDSLDVLHVKEHSYFTSGSESNHQKDQRKAVQKGHSNFDHTRKKKKKSKIEVNKPCIGGLKLS